MSEKEKQRKIQELLNRKRKMDTKTDEGPSTSSEKKTTKVEPEEDAKKEEKSEQYEKAKKALLFDAKRAKDRAGAVGPQGYLKPKSMSTNKQFLRRTIQSTLPRVKKNKPE